jgi:galactoside O-acetyltransferase
MSALIKEIINWVEFLLCNTPGVTGMLLRSLYYRMRLKGCGGGLRLSTDVSIFCPENISLGRDVTIMSYSKVYAGGEGLIRIGDNVNMNNNVMINARGKGLISIGNSVLIGPNAVIRSNNHSFDRTDMPIREQGVVRGEITIEDDVWIAANAVILPDVRVGKGAIVAAGAVVTKDVAPFTIVGGVPARPIGVRGEKGRSPQA